MLKFETEFSFMSIRLALPGNRYLRHTQLFLKRLGDYDEMHLQGRFKFDIRSCPIIAFITKAKDTLALVSQAAVDVAIVPDEWLFEYEAAAPDTLCILGAVPWLNVRLSLFSLPLTAWPAIGSQSIVTPFPNLARKQCQELGLSIKRLICVSGTTEIFVPAIADLGFDTVETGTTLTSHGLVEVHTAHTKLGLSLVCRHKDKLGMTSTIEELLREAYEARIIGPD